MREFQPNHRPRDKNRVAEYLRKVVNAIPDAIFVHDLDGRVLDVNRKALQMFGCTREEALRFRLREYWVSGTPLADLPILWEKAVSGEDQQLEHTLRRPKDGLIFNAEISLTRLSLSEGDFILALVRDITERRKVEEDLKATKDFLFAILNNTYDAIYLHDLDGKIVQVNDRMLESHGAKCREEVIGLRIRDVSAPDSPVDELKKIWSKAVAGENQFHEWTGRRLTDGSVFPVEVYLTKVSLRGADYILANVRDITERKRIEDLLIKEKQKFQAVVESSPVGKAIIGMDDDTPYFKYVNPTFRAIFGYGMNEVPEFTGWLKILGIRPRPETETDLGENISKRLVQVISTPSSRRIKANDGKVKHVTFIPSQLETGEMLLTCEDVTVRKQAQEKMKQHNLELEILNDLIASVTCSLQISQINDTIRTIFAERLAVDAGAVFSYDNLSGKFRMKTFWGIPEGSPKEFEAFALHCYAGLSSTEEKGMILTRSRINFPAGAPDWIKKQGWEGCLCVSVFREGQLQGMVFVVDKDYEKFGEDHAEFFETLSRQMGIAIQNAKLFEKVEQSHTEMRSLSLRLVNAQEGVRRYIARELHDEIGQVLTGLKLVLEMHALECEGKMTERLSEAMTTVNQLQSFVRELSLDLRPALLDVLGLFRTLPWYFERFRKKTSITVHFQYSNVENNRFPAEKETAIYRIVQEALTNVARHAQVNEVAVRLWYEDKTLKVQIQDKGAGFDAESALRAGNTNGLNGMRERATLLGGHFTIETHPGSGTRLTAELPAG